MPGRAYIAGRAFTDRAAAEQLAGELLERPAGATFWLGPHSARVLTLELEEPE